MELLTYRLNNGVNVLARYKNDVLFPYQYLTKQQAEKRALEVNGEVIRPTRAFYVKVNKG